MKKLFLIAILVCTAQINFAQRDTLFIGKGKKIVCKITEVNEFEIKYHADSALKGPISVINKNTVTKFTLFIGFTETIRSHELSLENEHKGIAGNRQVIKTNPFSAAFNHISLGFEKVIKIGMNLDVQIGYVNSTMNNSDYSPLEMNLRVYHVGGYIKPGIKLFLGQEFSMRGLRYAHPLKGRYLRFDIAISFLNFQNVNGYLFEPQTIQSTGTTTLITTNVNSISYGGFLNYGRQFILGNVLTIECFFGIGLTGQSESYSNLLYKDAYDDGNGRGFSTDGRENNNYYGFVRLPRLGELGGQKFTLAGTIGLRVGYIIPSKKTYRVKKNEDRVKN